MVKSKCPVCDKDVSQVTQHMKNDHPDHYAEYLSGIGKRKATREPDVEGEGAVGVAGSLLGGTVRNGSKRPRATGVDEGGGTASTSGEDDEGRCDARLPSDLPTYQG